MNNHGVQATQAVRVAAVQSSPVFLDRDATVEKVGGLIDKAAAEGAGLIVFPETFVPAYPDRVWRSRPWDDGASEWYARLLDRSVVIGEILAGPLVDEEGIVVADLDVATAHASRRQFDPVGHYARPDVFRLQVDTRPKPPVEFT